MATSAMWKSLIFSALVTLACPVAFAGNTAVLSTQHYIVVIITRCPEGDVSCDDVLATAVNKASGETEKLKGSDWAHLCDDHVTPCHHVGYKFHCEGRNYYITDSGTLTFTSVDEKVIFEENGKWLE